MSKQTFLIIYGAAVKAGGGPSGTLLRRVQGAWEISQRLATPCYFIVTGGVGKHAPSEAHVMQKLLLDLGEPMSKSLWKIKPKILWIRPFIALKYLLVILINPKMITSLFVLVPITIIDVSYYCGCWMLTLSEQTCHRIKMPWEQLNGCVTTYAKP